MQRLRPLTILALLAVLLFNSASLAAAQTSTELKHARPVVLKSLPTAAPPTQAELEQFRGELVRMLRDMDQQRSRLRQNPLVRRLIGSDENTSVTLPQAQQQLQQLTSEQLAQLYQGFATGFPNWRTAPQTLRNLADRFERGHARQAGPDTTTDTSHDADVTVVAGSAVVQAITPDNCQDAFNAAPSWTDWTVTEALAIAAQGAYEVIPPPLNAIAMAAWIPLEEGAHAAEALNLIFERCSGNQDIQNIQSTLTQVQSTQNTIIGNIDARTNTILDNLTSAQTAIINNDNSNKTAIINNANANTTTLNTAISDSKTTIINNDNSNTATLSTAISNAQTQIINNSNANKNELRDLILRTQIEADLAEADSATPVGLYLTPTAKGGYLDLVQTIVTQTLANIQAAGGSIGDAQSFLTQANAQKTAGQFKAAYKLYRKAYKTAVNA
jgi:hypothetical protein